MTNRLAANGLASGRNYGRMSFTTFAQVARTRPGVAAAVCWTRIPELPGREGLPAHGLATVYVDPAHGVLISI